MSSPISALWQDVRLEDIRRAVQQKTGTIPFLLLPVRLETRFMEVNKDILTDNVSVSAVLNFFAQIQVQAVDLSHQVGVSEVQLAPLMASVNDLQNAISKLQIVLTKEKSWLTQLNTEFAKDLLLIVRNNNLNLQNATTTLAALKKSIDDLAVRQESQAPEGQAFIETIKGHFSTISDLNNPRRTPYINVKNKKNLYAYIEKSLNDVVDFYQNAPQNVVAIKTIFKNQTARIEALHQSIKVEIAKLPASLRAIHADAAWQEFVAKMTNEPINSLQTTHFVSFENNIIPALKNLPQPEITLDAKDIHFHGIETLIYLHRFNTPPLAQKFDAAKSLQDRLAPRMKALSRAFEKKINVPESDVAHLQNIYQQIQVQLNVSNNKVQQYQAKNNSQRIGVQTISKFINVQAIGIIDKVFSPEIIPVVVNTKVHELWVRIYPDDIFVQTHEEELTKNEVISGKTFWKLWWAATNNYDLELGAFRGLAKSLGVRRAAWVARLLNPKQVNSAKNTQSLAAKPSKQIVDAASTLEDIYKIYAAMTTGALDKTPEAVIGALDPLVLNAISVQLQSVFTKIKLVKFEQDQMIQRFQTAIIRLSSAMNVLIDKGNKIQINGNVLKPKLDALAQNVSDFQKITGVFDKIEVVPIEAFIDRLPEPFDYPGVALKDEKWSKAPHTEMLPDRFVVVTMQGETFTHIVVGEKIPDSLQIGIDPSNLDETLYHLDENNDLQIDEKLLWMTEYSEAVKNGMGISVPLTKDQFQQGFDKVFVIGIKDFTPDISQKALEKLLQNHIYAPDGMAFLKVGTPTNNTHQEKAGFNPDNDLEKIFNIEVTNEVIKRRSYLGDLDGDRLQNSFGIADDILNHAAYFQNTQVSDAIATNRALWNATVGHYMEEMWDGIFTYDNISRTEKYFINNCVGRGFLPSIRVGEQPYGILATTAFSQFQLYPDAILPKVTPQEMDTPITPNLDFRLQKRFDLRLFQILNKLQDVWKTFQVLHSSMLNDGNDDTTYQKRFVEMLGLHATSLDYHVRYGVNVAKGPNATNNANSVATNFGVNDIFGPFTIFGMFKDIIATGVFEPSFFYWDEHRSVPVTKSEDDAYRYTTILQQLQDSRIFSARFLPSQPFLKGNLVDKVVFNDKTLSNDYIKFLLESHPDNILASNNWANLPDKSLLFMLLRQSIMQAYQEASLAILQTENVINEFSRRSLGSTNRYYIYRGKGDKFFSTKWHYLMKTLKDLQPMGFLDSNNAFYKYMIQKGGVRPAMSFYVFPSRTKTVVDNNGEHQVINNKLVDNYPNKARQSKILDKLDEVRASFKVLENLPTAELEILLAEHLDLATYRLDAWMLGLVNRRLTGHRKLSKNGIHLGAFGWIEDLRPDTNRKAKPTNEIPETLRPINNEPVYTDPDNEGFIHAPSVNQGIAAAILRSGYLNDKKNQGASSRLSINLSSERVRMALSLIEGIRNGMELGTILGFQFERGLHERHDLGVELDKYIQKLRTQFPLIAAIQETADGKTPDYQPHVVHGLNLLNKIYDQADWHNNKEQKTLEIYLLENNFAKCPAFIKNLTNNANELTAIIKEIDRMADALDALGDLVMSESVYQIVEGNHVRAAAMLSALSPDQRTASTIPDPQIVDTPRTGTIVTHRVVLSLPVLNAPQQPAGWENAIKSARATAEPTLNFWLGNLLGSPKNIGCEVIIKAKDANDQSFSVNLEDLKWQPIDYFFMAAEENGLSAAIAYLIRKNENIDDEKDVIPNLKVNLHGKSLYEMDWLLGQIRMLLSGAKYIGDADFLPADQKPKDRNNEGQFDAKPFVDQAKASLKTLTDLKNQLENNANFKAVLDGTKAAEVIELTNGDIQLFTEILEKFFEFGIPNVLPTVQIQTEKTWAKFIRQVITANKEANKRINEATDLINQILPTTTDQLAVEKAEAAIKALFGKGFLMLPQFKLGNIATLKDQIDNINDNTRGILRNGNALTMEKWLHGIGKIREKMYAVEMVGFGTDSLQTEPLGILPTQLSYTDKDFWLGIDYPDSFKIDGDKLSIAVIQPANLGETSVGIMIDEWVEILPNKEETTGLTFNYNQPDATPPQTILLAVNPKDNLPWQWDDLLFTLKDTLQLAKLRGVEPDHLEKSSLSQILPGILAEVVPSDVVDKDGNALGVQVALDFINNNS